MTYLRCEISEYETREVLSILYDFPDDKSSFTFRVPGRAEDVLIGKRILADALGGSGIDISLTEDDEEVEDMPIDLYDSLPKSPTGDFIPPAPFKGGVQGEPLVPFPHTDPRGISSPQPPKKEGSKGNVVPFPHQDPHTDTEGEEEEEDTGGEEEDTEGEVCNQVFKFDAEPRGISSPQPPRGISSPQPPLKEGFKGNVVPLVVPFPLTPHHRRTPSLEKLITSQIRNIGIATDTPGGGKAFGMITAVKLKEIIHSNKTLYELVAVSGAVRLYFDIEWIADELDATRFKDILGVISGKVGAEHKPYVLTASRETDDGFKHSYHIHFPSVVLESQAHLKAFVHSLMVQIHTENTECLFCDNDPTIDWSVYNRWGQFRLPFQTGLKKTRRLEPVGLVGDFELDNYLININDTSPEFVITSVNPEGHHVLSKDRARILSGKSIRGISSPQPPDKEGSKGNVVPLHDFERGILSPGVDLSSFGDSALTHYLKFINPSCDFDTWAKVGICIHNCGGSFELFDTWSRGSWKYKGDCRRVWDKITDSEGVGIGTLYHYAKLYSPDTFCVYNEKVSYDDFMIPSGDETPLTFDNRLGKLDIKKRITLIHSGMGSGKTYRIREYIIENDPKNILIIAPRITYADFISAHMRDLGFKNYKDLDGKISASRVVCSIESLHRVIDYTKFDLVIMDEIETILCSLTSPTNESHYNEVIDAWNYIVANTQIIGGDAFLSMRSLTYFPDADIITHNTQYPEKTMVKLQDPRDFKDKVIELVKDGANLYIVCHSKAYLLNTLAPALEKIKKIIYHRDMKNSIKITLKNVEEEWGTKQVIATTPTITIGIDQSKTHFTHRMLYTCSASANARDTAQALWRVRNTTSGTDYWYNDPTPHHAKLQGEPVQYDKLRDFYETKRWRSLPHRIVSDEKTRELFFWNRTERNQGYVAFETIMTGFLERLGYKIVKAETEQKKLIKNIKTPKIKYGDIPIISEERYHILKDRSKNGGESHFGEMETLSIRKHRLLKLTRGVETGVDKLWKDLDYGYNLKPITFTHWSQSPDMKPKSVEQRDIYYRDTLIHYDIIKRIHRLLPPTGSEIKTEHAERLTRLFADNGKKWKESAKINTRGGDKHIIKSVNALLKRFSLIRLKRTSRRIGTRAEGKTEHYFKVSTPYPEVMESLNYSGEGEYEIID